MLNSKNKKQKVKFRILAGKKTIIFPFFAFLTASVFAQSTDPQNIKVVATQDPAYPKGEPALYNYVLMNVKYSDEAKKKYIEGEVMMSFYVNVDSTVSNTKIISGAGYGIDEEVKRVVSGLKFSPGMMNGKARKMQLIMSFPVKAH
jgi:TonB family protein